MNEVKGEIPSISNQAPNAFLNAFLKQTKCSKKMMLSKRCV